MAKREVITASLEYEKELYARGFRLIAGLDEAGRGAWAGPVAAAAVILPLDREDLSEVLAGVIDSKQLDAQQRQSLAATIKSVALDWAVGRTASFEVDKEGIVVATQLAMERALRKLTLVPDYLLTDYVGVLDTAMPEDRQMRLIKGDEKSLSIAAASILAKVERDAFMLGLDEQYPEYGFARHKGYGTQEHKLNLSAHGPCSAHRGSFKPIINWRTLLAMPRPGGAAPVGEKEKESREPEQAKEKAEPPAETGGAAETEAETGKE